MNKSIEIENFLNNLISKMHHQIEVPIIGVYLHGSLDMGGFNPERSDIDLLVVTEDPIAWETKKKLVPLFLAQSSNPYPVEINFLNLAQLEKWQFPTPYDFHFSEFWRERYEQDESAALGIDEKEKTDVDLAAHFMILNHRGICLEGRPIHEVFPAVPETDYLASILDDYEDCLEKIQQEPVYSLLNLLRVYWYIKEKEISSKKEAGEWGMANLPQEFTPIIEKTAKIYVGEELEAEFDAPALTQVKDYIKGEVERLLGQHQGNVKRS